MKSREVAVIKGVLAGLWAPSAYAATITLGSSLAGVPALAWALVLVLSSISGLAALLNKLKDATPSSLVLFVCAHMLGSMLCGVLTFLFLSGLGSVQDFFQVVIISVGAYAGATWLDAAAGRGADWLQNYKKDDTK